HHETARRADGDAEVHAAVVDDVVAVDARVHHADVAQRDDDRAREQLHEPEVDTVPGAEALTGTLAQGEQLAAVDLVEGGEDRGRALCLHQAARDRPAQLAHRHTLDVGLARATGAVAAV